MTSPNNQVPAGAAQTGTGDSAGLAAFAAKTGDQWKAGATSGFESSYGGGPFGFLGKLIANLFGGFGGGLGGFISSLFGGLSGTSGGGFLDLLGSLVGIRSQAQLAKDASDAAAAQAQGALTAATAADKKITALLQGGTRTVYTSNATYTPSPNLVKVGVLLYGGGRKGFGAGPSAAGGLGGGVIYAEFLPSVLPSSVPITIGAGSSGPTVSAPTTFGSLLSSADSGGGQLQNSTLIALASSVFPGNGGASGYRDTGSSNDGLPGGSTALANGGAGGTSSSSAGGAGGNASVTGQYLAGGGGGGGGRSSSANFGVAGNGGAGGFPGGGGGGAGRNNNEAYWVGGVGAPGLAAIIEFTPAA